MSLHLNLQCQRTTKTKTADNQCAPILKPREWLSEDVGDQWKCNASAPRPVRWSGVYGDFRFGSNPFLQNLFHPLPSSRHEPVNAACWRDWSRLYARPGPALTRLSRLNRAMQIRDQQAPARFGSVQAVLRRVAGTRLCLIAILHRLLSGRLHCVTLGMRLPNTSPGNRLASMTLTASKVAITPIAALDGGTPNRPSHAK